MTKDEFHEEVYAVLGGTLVDVELQPTDLDVCFKRAVRMMKRKGHAHYRRCFYPLEVIKDQRTYEIPEDIDTIVKVVKPSHSFTADNPFSMASYQEVFGSTYGTGGGRARTDYLSYELTLQMIEKWNRYAANDAAFEHDRFRHTILLHNVPKKNTTWLLDCYRSLEDEEFMQLDWIIRWTTAEAKEMLGMAYGKFQSVAGPNGETSLDGQRYTQEAQNEKELLLQDIENFTDGEADYMPIVLG